MLDDIGIGEDGHAHSLDREGRDHHQSARIRTRRSQIVDHSSPRAGTMTLVSKGVRVLRSLTGQTLRPPSDGQPDRESSTALGSDTGLGSAT
jgi:hypothetical protein